MNATTSQSIKDQLREQLEAQTAVQTRRAEPEADGFAEGVVADPTNPADGITDFRDLETPDDIADPQGSAVRNPSNRNADIEKVRAAVIGEAGSRNELPFFLADRWQIRGNTCVPTMAYRTEVINAAEMVFELIQGGITFEPDEELAEHQLALCEHPDLGEAYSSALPFQIASACARVAGNLAFIEDVAGRDQSKVNEDTKVRVHEREMENRVTARQARIMYQVAAAVGALKESKPDVKRAVNNSLRSLGDYNYRTYILADPTANGSNLAPAEKQKLRTALLADI